MNEVKKLAVALKALTDHHSDQVIPAVQHNRDEILQLREEVSALYELMEMYVAIAFRLGLSDTEDGIEVFNAIQTEYLACLSLQHFLQNMAKMSQTS